MRFSLRLNNDLPLADYVALARIADAVGFDQLWVSNDLFLRSAPVILAAVHLSPPWVPPALPLLAAPCVSIVLALALFRLVEMPAMQFGRRLALALEHRHAGARRAPLGRDGVA